MKLRHLTIFRAVCQTESITLAAEHLNMTQPAVSLAVRELEDFYGVQLFERMNRRIYITEAGRTLLQYADTILSQYAESVQVLQEARHREAAASVFTLPLARRCCRRSCGVCGSSCPISPCGRL
ncbi:MAG: LysR family transcriptional regulator [Oscillospiraceae bacterium]